MFVCYLVANPLNIADTYYFDVNTKYILSGAVKKLAFFMIALQNSNLIHVE